MNTTFNGGLRTVHQEIVDWRFLQGSFSLVTRPLNLEGFLQVAETNCLKRAHTKQMEIKTWNWLLIISFSVIVQKWILVLQNWKSRKGSLTFFTMVVSLGSTLTFFASELSWLLSAGFTNLGFSLRLAREIIEFKYWDMEHLDSHDSHVHVHHGKASHALR